MKGNDTPRADEYLKLFASKKHPNFINLYDAENACKIAAAEAMVDMADALNLNSEEIERVRKQLTEFERIFKLNKTK